MPYLHLTLGRKISAEQENTLARHSTELLASLLHKRAEVTAVRIECTADAWFITGERASAEETPCHGIVFITSGSNGEAEKAAFLAAWHALLVDTLGPLPLASYLVIQEIPASSWGYAGQTQAARQAAAKPL